MKKAKFKTIRLTSTQWDCPANFADASFDYPRKSFEQVAQMLLGPNPFPKTTNGAYFKKSVPGSLRAGAKEVVTKEPEYAQTICVQLL